MSCHLLVKRSEENSPPLFACGIRMRAVGQRRRRGFISGALRASIGREKDVNKLRLFSCFSRVFESLSRTSILPAAVISHMDPTLSDLKAESPPSHLRAAHLSLARLPACLSAVGVALFVCVCVYLSIALLTALNTPQTVCVCVCCGVFSGTGGEQRGGYTVTQPPRMADTLFKEPK